MISINPRWLFRCPAYLLWLSFAGSVPQACLASGTYYQCVYVPSSATAGGLSLKAVYTLWVPDGVSQLRALIVHQHGCGFDANAAGETAAYDLHWQSLAKKWDAALLSPRYHQTEQGREACHLWSDPRRGSRDAMLQSLATLASQSKHPELTEVPWCLWGHSGGASWTSVMQTLDPERIVAAWLRSGTAFPMWESGEYPKPDFRDEVFRIPTMLNPGIKESTDGRPVAAWLGSSAMLKDYRLKNAPIGFAADPLSGHDCGDSRYLAIPYFDVCLELRLPPTSSADSRLRPIDISQGWLAELMGRTAVRASDYKGRVNTAVWLPNERFAKLWMEYVVTGRTSDTTPPPPPIMAIWYRQADGSHVVEWDAEADLESGLRGFVIECDGKEIARIPPDPIGHEGRPLFQSLSFHDTPVPPLPRMQFIDREPSRPECVYQVKSVNSLGLFSKSTMASGKQNP